MPQFSTHYDNLQVKETASEEVIKGAYRYLSQKWHPDRNLDNREEAERIIKLINEAYAVLSDPIRRKEYDEWIKIEREGASEQTPNEPSPPHAQPQNNEERAGPPFKIKKSRTKDTIGFWIQGALALVLVKTVGFLGAIASFVSYYWLKPKLGTVGALACSVILGVTIGLIAMTQFTQGTSIPNNAPHRTGESTYSEAADRPPAQEDGVRPSNAEGVETFSSNVTGVWTGLLDYRGEGLMVINKAGSGYFVSIEISAPGCVGAIDGTGYITDKALKLVKVEYDNTCELTVEISGDVVNVSQKSCSYYHGAACSFDGTYRRAE